jgi:hypothetical protein
LFPPVGEPRRGMMQILLHDKQRECRFCSQRFPLESTVVAQDDDDDDGRFSSIDPISDLYGGPLSQPFVVFVRRGIFCVGPRNWI